MTESRQNMVVAGALLLMFAIVFLISNPREILATASFFIDTELGQSSGLEVPVSTKMELGNKEHLKNFPIKIGEWTGHDYSGADIADQLSAGAIFMKTYVDQTFPQPVDLLIMYSHAGAVFNPPVVSYPALGYKIEEEGKDLVYVKDASWIERSKSLDVSKLPDWVREKIGSTPISEIGYWVSVKKLVVFKEEQEKVTDRQVVLYFYIRDKAIITSIGMMRGSTQAPLSGSYEESVNAVRELMGLAIPRMFAPEKPGIIFISLLASWGMVGYVTILLLLFIPSAIMGYPIWRAMKSQQSKAEQEAEQSAS